MRELGGVYEYLRWRKKFPTVWCPGCGIGSIMGAIIRAIMELNIPKDDVTLVAGIGCASRMPVYLDFNSLHTTHGRALAFATGVKMHRPDMTVLVVSGDGDSLAIGGNHFIHAARRNIDLTLVLVNNAIYGMTGGQVAPTTPKGAVAHTMPYGNIDPPFDAVELALAAGATFVARSTVADITRTTACVRRGLAHPGFALVEVISQCPTQYGRLNGSGDARAMLRAQKERSVTRETAAGMAAEELQGKIIIGIFREEIRQEYTAAYRDCITRVQAEQ